MGTANHVNQDALFIQGDISFQSQNMPGALLRVHKKNE